MNIHADWDEGDCGWDLGSAEEFPALKCLFITPAEQRTLYEVSGSSLIIHGSSE